MFGLQISQQSKDVPTTAIRVFRLPGISNEVFALFGTAGGAVFVYHVQREAEAGQHDSQREPAAPQEPELVAALQAPEAGSGGGGGGMFDVQVSGRMVAAVSGRQVSVWSLQPFQQQALLCGRVPPLPCSGAARLLHTAELEAPCIALAWTQHSDALLLSTAASQVLALSVRDEALARGAAAAPRLWQGSAAQQQALLAAGSHMLSIAATMASASCQQILLWHLSFSPAAAAASAAGGSDGAGSLLLQPEAQPLRHTVPVVTFAWAPSLTEVPADLEELAVLPSPALRALPNPPLVTLTADGVLRVWVEVDLSRLITASTHGVTAPHKLPPSPKKQFCMQLVVEPQWVSKAVPSPLSAGRAEAPAPAAPPASGPYLLPGGCRTLAEPGIRVDVFWGRPLRLVEDLAHAPRAQQVLWLGLMVVRDPAGEAAAATDPDELYLVAVDGVAIDEAVALALLANAASTGAAADAAAAEVLVQPHCGALQPHALVWGCNRSSLRWSSPERLWGGSRQRPWVQGCMDVLVQDSTPLLLLSSAALQATSGYWELRSFSVDTTKLGCPTRVHSKRHQHQTLQPPRPVLLEQVAAAASPQLPTAEVAALAIGQEPKPLAAALQADGTVSFWRLGPPARMGAVADLALAANGGGRLVWLPRAAAPDRADGRPLLLVADASAAYLLAPPPPGARRRRASLASCGAQIPDLILASCPLPGAGHGRLIALGMLPQTPDASSKAEGPEPGVGALNLAGDGAEGRAVLLVAACDDPQEHSCLRWWLLRCAAKAGSGLLRLEASGSLPGEAADVDATCGVVAVAARRGAACGLWALERPPEAAAPTLCHLADVALPASAPSAAPLLAVSLENALLAVASGEGPRGEVAICTLDAVAPASGARTLLLPPLPPGGGSAACLAWATAARMHPLLAVGGNGGGSAVALYGRTRTVGGGLAWRLLAALSLASPVRALAPLGCGDGRLAIAAGARLLLTAAELDGGSAAAPAPLARVLQDHSAPAAPAELDPRLLLQLLQVGRLRAAAALVRAAASALRARSQRRRGAAQVPHEDPLLLRLLQDSPAQAALALAWRCLAAPSTCDTAASSKAGSAPQAVATPEAAGHWNGSGLPATAASAPMAAAQSAALANAAQAAAGGAPDPASFGLGLQQSDPSGLAPSRSAGAAPSQASSQIASGQLDPSAFGFGPGPSQPSSTPSGEAAAAPSSSQPLASGALDPSAFGFQLSAAAPPPTRPAAAVQPSSSSQIASGQLDPSAFGFGPQASEAKAPPTQPAAAASPSSQIASGQLDPAAFGFGPQASVAKAPPAQPAAAASPSSQIASGQLDPSAFGFGPQASEAKAPPTQPAASAQLDPSAFGMGPSVEREYPDGKPVVEPGPGQAQTRGENGTASAGGLDWLRHSAAQGGAREAENMQHGCSADPSSSPRQLSREAEQAGASCSPADGLASLQGVLLDQADDGDLLSMEEMTEFEQLLAAELRRSPEAAEGGQAAAREGSGKSGADGGVVEAEGEEEEKEEEWNHASGPHPEADMVDSTHAPFVLRPQVAASLLVLARLLQAPQSSDDPLQTPAVPGSASLSDDLADWIPPAVLQVLDPPGASARALDAAGRVVLLHARLAAASAAWAEASRQAAAAETPSCSGADGEDADSSGWEELRRRRQPEMSAALKALLGRMTVGGASAAEEEQADAAALDAEAGLLPISKHDGQATGLQPHLPSWTLLWALQSASRDAASQQALLHALLPYAGQPSKAADRSTAAAFLALRPQVGAVPPLCWAGLRGLGVGFWLTDPAAVKTLAEQLAHAQYQERKDPEDCALLYMALGKRTLLQGLFRTASQGTVSKFMSRDFTQEKHRVAACKNVYVLLGQHRPALAACFFLLAGCAWDCVDVCFRDMEDAQLALFVARLLDAPAQDGPLLRRLLPLLLQNAEPGHGGGRDTTRAALLWLGGGPDAAAAQLASCEVGSGGGADELAAGLHFLAAHGLPLLLRSPQWQASQAVGLQRQLARLADTLHAAGRPLLALEAGAVSALLLHGSPAHAAGGPHPAAALRQLQARALQQRCLRLAALLAEGRSRSRKLLRGRSACDALLHAAAADLHALRTVLPQPLADGAAEAAVVDSLLAAGHLPSTPAKEDLSSPAASQHAPSSSGGQLQRRLRGANADAAVAASPPPPRPPQQQRSVELQSIAARMRRLFEATGAAGSSAGPGCSAAEWQAADSTHCKSFDTQSLKSSLRSSLGLRPAHLGVGAPLQLLQLPPGGRLSSICCSSSQLAAESLGCVPVVVASAGQGLKKVRLRLPFHLQDQQQDRQQEAASEDLRSPSAPGTPDSPPTKGSVFAGLMQEMLASLRGEAGWVRHVVGEDRPPTPPAPAEEARRSEAAYKKQASGLGLPQSHTQVLAAHGEQPVFLSGSESGVVRLWSFVDGRCKAEFSPVTARMAAAGMAVKGRHTAQGLPHINFGHKHRGDSLPDLEHWQGAAGLRFSACGSRLAAIGNGGLACIWRLEGGAAAAPGGAAADWALQCMGRSGRDVAFAGASSSMLVLAGACPRRGPLSLWDSLMRPSSACVGVLAHSYRSPVVGLAPIDGALQVVSGSASHGMAMHDLRMMSRAPVWQAADPGSSRLTCLAAGFTVPPAGAPIPVLASGSRDGSLFLRSWASGQLLYHLALAHWHHQHPIQGLFSGRRDGGLGTGDELTRGFMQGVPANAAGQPVTGLAVCSDGVLSCGHDGALRFHPLLWANFE